ncbi:DUF962-domain-containing protein [Phellopilus nigrolimitatus]|nr:DUF962-domain-containing protein [Phellopilus nigrolimitatus]
MASNLLNVEKQLVFYGAYHTNKVNIRIHMLCVPYFDMLNWATVQAAVYLGYFFLLLPTGALLYTPQMIASLLSATVVARDFKNVQYAFVLHVASWLAQFYGHGVHEHRAPALLDNLIGAVVLAPFFVHLELLFEFGYFSTLYKAMKNDIGVEVAKIRRANAAAKRSN